MALLRRIAGELPGLPEGSIEPRNAHTNLQNIRMALALNPCLDCCDAPSSHAASPLSFPFPPVMETPVNVALGCDNCSCGDCQSLTAN
jgi:hypothetical protein